MTSDAPARSAPLRRLLVLSSALVSVGLFLYAETLRMSYAYDDVDFLNLSADVLAGKRSLSSLTFFPNGEHLIPVLRLAFHGSVWLFGTDARPFRAVVLLAHVASGLFLSLLARRFLPRPGVAAATGLTYVGAG